MQYRAVNCTDGLFMYHTLVVTLLLFKYVTKDNWSQAVGKTKRKIQVPK